MAICRGLIKLLASALALSLSFAPRAFAQAQQQDWPFDLHSELRELVDTRSISGYEHAASEQIRKQIAAFHPPVDNLGDVIVTIGSGSPHRLLVAPVDEPGFLVSEITPDGYLRLRRLPQSGLPPIFNELFLAQPVHVQTASGTWINGVVAGTSIHLHGNGEPVPALGDLNSMYVDIGATSAAGVRAAGIDLLSPVAIDRDMLTLNGSEMAGSSVGDKFGAAALEVLLQEVGRTNIEGTLTVAFVVQQRTGARGLQRILSTGHYDEMIYVGRLLPGGAIPGMTDIHRAPRREPGSGVLLGLPETSVTLSGFSAELRHLAAENDIPFATDYSADIIPPSYIAAPALPAKFAHIAIATAWPDTPIAKVAPSDLRQLTDFLERYLEVVRPGPELPEPPGFLANIDTVPLPLRKPPEMATLLARLSQTYGTSNHESPVRDEVKSFMPQWAKPETDGAGNLILHLGTASAGSKVPKILIVAHLDEIGFEVKSISDDGRLLVSPLGGMDLNYYEGHPVLIHTAWGNVSGILELPSGWDRPDFRWPDDSSPNLALRVDVGARNSAEVAKLGIRVGDSITIPKQYRPLLGPRASVRSFDDRVGDAALVSAVWNLGQSLSGRDVTFVWSTGEELGLDGAQALAKRLAAEGREPDYVFAVDTFVSSDSPLESKRYADAELGKGFVVRAIDNSNIVPRNLVERLVQLARANHIPVQYGVTAGGNDGAAFVPYGSLDIGLGWPLRYSHSPAEEIDTRDADALARIIVVIAKSW